MYQEAFRLPKPRYILDIQIEPRYKTEINLLDFDKGGTFECPKCGEKGCKPHDTHPERKRHFFSDNFFY
jgi:hypothetical protein